jgi:hypothetical protein
MDAREFFQKVVVPRYMKFVRRRWSRPLPSPSFARSATPQRKSLLLPAMQPGTLVQRMATSRFLIASLRRPRQWEAALDKAKEREPEGWPLIITDDFF